MPALPLGRSTVPDQRSGRRDIITARTPVIRPRLWIIEVVPDPHSLPLRCLSCCAPVSVSRTVRQAVLVHLAEHARRERLDPHLRTCRCGAGGCRWHTRRRTCEGEITLALTRRERYWRLADLCHGCTAATPHTASVAETGDRRPSSTAQSPSTEPWMEQWDGDDAQLWWQPP